MFRQHLGRIAAHMSKFGKDGFMVGATLTLAGELTIVFYCFKFFGLDFEVFSALNWLLNRPQRVATADVEVSVVFLFCGQRSALIYARFLLRRVQKGCY